MAEGSVHVMGLSHIRSRQAGHTQSVQVAAEELRVEASNVAVGAMRTVTGAAGGAEAVDASIEMVFLAITVVLDTARAGAGAEAEAAKSDAGAVVNSGCFAEFGSNDG